MQSKETLIPFVAPNEKKISGARKGDDKLCCFIAVDVYYLRGKPVQAAWSAFILQLLPVGALGAWGALKLPEHLPAFPACRDISGCLSLSGKSQGPLLSWTCPATSGAAGRAERGRAYPHPARPMPQVWLGGKKPCSQPCPWWLLRTGLAEWRKQEKITWPCPAPRMGQKVTRVSPNVSWHSWSFPFRDAGF